MVDPNPYTKPAEPRWVDQLDFQPEHTLIGFATKM